MPCTVGGPPPGGNNNPCQTITADLLEYWPINEGAGATAFGYLGLCNLQLADWGYWSQPDDAWHHPADNDSGRGFFGGSGYAELPTGLGILSHVGDGFTIAQRRWYTGLEHVRDPIPLTMTSFGFVEYVFLNLRGFSGPPVPRIYGRPEIDFNGSPPYPVIPGGYFRQGGTAIPGTLLPGVPANYPPTVEPAPYLVVVTAVATAIDRVEVSVFGHDGTTFIPGVCFNTPADGSSGHSGDSGTGGAPPGTPTNYGDLRRLDVGGFFDDTIHQAAIWNRALTPAEVQWLGSDLDRLRLSIDMPGSQCEGGGGGCSEVAGSGTVNPLLNADGTTAIHPEFPASRRDPLGVIASDGSELRETRRVHEGKPRVYELAWSLAGGAEVELVRQALEVTRGGAHHTRWRHPIDDAPGDVCAAPRWRILNAADAGFAVSRRRGGHVANLRLILEEVPLV